MYKSKTNSLKTRVSLVKGINQTSHDTNLRQSCNTCRYIIVLKTFLFLNLFIPIQKLVRFCADYRIKPHTPPLVVGSRQFLWVSILRLYFSGGVLIALAWKPNKKILLNYSTHNLQYRLPGYLILFAPYTFVPQRQFKLKNRLRYCWYSSRCLQVLPLYLKFYSSEKNSSEAVLYG